MKRNDIILIAVFLAAATILYISSSLLNQKQGALVQITVNGAVYKTLPLDKDTTIKINGYNNGNNTLQIKDGYASITDADCPDKLCQRQKKIRYKGESLVCLPHRVVVSVLSEEDSGIDNIAY